MSASYDDQQYSDQQYNDNVQRNDESLESSQELYDAKPVKDKKPETPSVRIGLFGKEIWWVWIVLALLIVLAVLIYIYICYARYCKKTRILANRVERAESNHRPTFRQPITARFPTNETRAKAIQAIESRALLVPSKMRRSKMIVPEDEWRGDAGLDWIEAKLRRLDNPPKLENNKATRVSKKLSKKPTIRIRISMSNHTEQDWNNQGGVFDIFARANNTKARARLGTCGNDTLPVLEGASTILLPFDSDYERLSRRTDSKYQHKTWWK